MAVIIPLPRSLSGLGTSGLHGFNASEARGQEVAEAYIFLFAFTQHIKTVVLGIPPNISLVESAFGSQPIIISFLPFSARAAARFWVVVDFPIPPFPYIAICLNLYQPF